MAEDPEGRPGVADAHGLIATVCGLGVFIAVCACCVDPIDDEKAIIPVLALVAATLWSGLFGVLSPGSPAGRALAVLGLVAVFVSTAVMFAMAVVGREPF